jgi:hypothetical protein
MLETIGFYVGCYALMLNGIAFFVIALFWLLFPRREDQ